MTVVVRISGVCLNVLKNKKVFKKKHLTPTII